MGSYPRLIPFDPSLPACKSRTGDHEWRDVTPYTRVCVACLALLDTIKGYVPLEVRFADA